MRASVNFYNMTGFCRTPITTQDDRIGITRTAAPLIKPSDQWSADLRVFRDRVETTAYYYVIPRDDEANPFSTFTTAPNANNSPARPD